MSEHHERSPDRLLISRVETFLLRLDGQGRPTSAEPRYRTLFDRGTLYSDLTETVLVRIETTEGVVGWGESLAPVGPRVTATVIDDVLRPVLLGQDASRPQALSERMQEAMRERGHLTGFFADGIAGVDIAIWDLVGRAQGRSVSELLGGARRTRIPTYVSSIAGDSPEERAATIADLVQSGAHRFKLHLGRGVSEDLAEFDRVADIVPAGDLAVDVHGVYSAAAAVALARGLADRGAWFLESAVPTDDLDELAAVSAGTTVPLAAGEALRNRFEVRPWLSRDLVQIVQPDVGRTGITEAWNIALAVTGAGRSIMPHHSVALAPALAAGLHVAAAVGEMPAFEYQIGAVRNANRLIADPFDAGPSHLTLPEGPGLGITMLEEEIRAGAAAARR